MLTFASGRLRGDVFGVGAEAEADRLAIIGAREYIKTLGGRAEPG